MFKNYSSLFIKTKLSINYMDRKLVHIIVTFLITGAITTTTLLFLFPYDPSKPPHLDDTGFTTQGIQEVADANNQFAWELYGQLTDSEDNNVFYSPYSIFSALAMTYEGAREQTADEMQSVFHFPAIDVLRPNFAAFYNGLNQERKNYELRTGNALWCQADFPFQEDYMYTVETYYGGKAANVDFVNETEKSRQTINSFIEEQTKDKITDLLPSGVINTLTRLVLTNAVYFEGEWVQKFDKRDTVEENFKITPDEVVKTPMMHMAPDEIGFQYADLNDLQILELPYKGDKISMLILLPKTNLSDIEPSLTAEKITEYRSSMLETKMKKICLPKFEFDTKYFMKDTLSSLGMPTAFSDAADFSGMTPADQLHISDAIHQGYIKVDEEGTEAAAAVAVVVNTLSIAPSHPIFYADHPFIFLIQDQETGFILFMGRVTDPTAE